MVGDVVAATVIGGMGLVLGRRGIQSFADRRLRGPAGEAVVALTRLTRGGSRVWRSFVAEQRFLFAELDGLAASLPAATMPAVVLHGRSDHQVRPVVAESLAARIPGAHLELVPGVGHLLPHDRPEAVAAAVDRVTYTAR